MVTDVHVPLCMHMCVYIVVIFVFNRTCFIIYCQQLKLLKCSFAVNKFILDTTHDNIYY